MIISITATYFSVLNDIVFKNCAYCCLLTNILDSVLWIKIRFERIIGNTANTVHFLYLTGKNNIFTKLYELGRSHSSSASRSATPVQAKTEDIAWWREIQQLPSHPWDSGHEKCSEKERKFLAGQRRPPITVWRQIHTARGEPTQCQRNVPTITGLIICPESVCNVCMWL